MGREKFGHSDENYRIRLVKSGDAEYVLGAGTTRPITLTVPNGVLWELLWIHDFWSCTATVGTRTPQVMVYETNALTNVLFRILSSATAAAGSSLRISFVPRQTTVTVNNTSVQPIAPLILLPGNVIVLDTTPGVDAADAHTSNFIFKEFC